MKQKGFTLLETLVAISILLIAVIGPMSLIGDSLHKLYYAKDEMIAMNLAQEGIEAVRWVRDTNMLSATPSWDTGISPGYYVVDAGNIGGASNSVVRTVAAITPQAVYLDGSASGFYWQDSTKGAITRFSRIIRIEQMNPGIENKVTSTVTWSTGNMTGSVTVSESIFKWAVFP